MRFLIFFSLMAMALLGGAHSRASTGLSCGKIFAGQSGQAYLTQSAPSLEVVLSETLAQRGHFTSRYHVSESEALRLGLLWLGDRYSEIGQNSSGVFLNYEGTKRFRLDPRSLDGAHSPGQPHVHLELVNPATQEVLSNNHVLLSKD